MEGSGGRSRRMREARTGETHGRPLRQGPSRPEPASMKDCALLPTKNRHACSASLWLGDVIRGYESDSSSKLPASSVVSGLRSRGPPKWHGTPRAGGERDLAPPDDRGLTRVAPYEGRQNKARGASPGSGDGKESSPERAAEDQSEARFSVALSGLSLFPLLIPGLAPRAVFFRPSRAWPVDSPDY